MYVCFNLAEIWYTYWGSKGEYQYQIWDKSDQHSSNFRRNSAMPTGSNTLRNKLKIGT